MALNGFLKLTGQVQGPIRGSVVQKGREGTILVRAADHLVTSPFDPGTLQFVGKRVFSPFCIVKEIDQASIPLRLAHAGNERFSEWELKLFRNNTLGSIGSASGTERNHFTIRLTDARVQQIRFVLPDTRDPALVSRADFEEIAFVYAKIEWTSPEPKQSFADGPSAGSVPKRRTPRR